MTKTYYVMFNDGMTPLEMINRYELFETPEAFFDQYGYNTALKIVLLENGLFNTTKIGFKLDIFEVEE